MTLSASVRQHLLGGNRLELQCEMITSASDARMFVSPFATYLQTMNATNDVLQALINHSMLLDGVESLEFLAGNDDRVERPAPARHVLDLDVRRREALGEKRVDLFLAR